MTIKDLLIKPIQRVPRYELLFGDLCKLTPVCDSPDANATLEQLRKELSSTCRRINEAKDKPAESRNLETTWLLGDRLTFSSQVPRIIFLRLLGQVQLCGCLHVTYRGKDRIQGTYAICVLFESTLVLADADEDQQKYSVLAGIALGNATVEEADNGKGLQCYTAPHSWKIIFEHAALVFEFILTACSAVEAEVWRSHLRAAIDMKNRAENTGLFELHSPLTAEMRSIGKAFGKPSSFVRRMSVHRAATVGPNTDLNQVILKNTQAVKEVQDSSSQTSLRIPRSQSVVTPSHVQILAPRRALRHRLETLLADVWTKDLLPYPGMVRRSDPIRASANHVIRKFSMASITSNFSSKRTASSTSINMLRRREDEPKRARQRSDERRGHETNLSENRARRPRAPPNSAVNFHTTPAAFLPTDFQIAGRATKPKPSVFRSFTTAIERPFSPLLGSDSPRIPLRRAHSTSKERERGKGTTENILPVPQHSHQLSPAHKTENNKPSTITLKHHPELIGLTTSSPSSSAASHTREPTVAPALTPSAFAYSIVRDRPQSPATMSLHSEPFARKARGKSMLSRIFG